MTKSVEEKEPVVEKSENFNVEETTKIVLEIAKGVFVKPISTIKKFNNLKNIKLAYILLALAVFAQALFVTVTVNHTVSEMAASMSDVDGFDDLGMGSLLMGGLMYGSYDEDENADMGFADNIIEFDEDAENFEDAISVKVVNVFIYSALATALMYGIIAGAIYIVINKFMKKDMNFKEIMMLLSLIFTIETIMYLVSTVSIFLSTLLTFIILVFGSLYVMVTLYQSLVETKSLDKDKFGLMFTSIYAIVAVVVYVLFKLFM